MNNMDARQKPPGVCLQQTALQAARNGSLPGRNESSSSKEELLFLVFGIFG